MLLLLCTISIFRSTCPPYNDTEYDIALPACRFEQLALGYDSDQIGDLEEDPEEAQGCADLDAYGNVLDNFLESFATTDHAHESGARYHTLAEEAPHEAARLRVSLKIIVPSAQSCQPQSVDQGTDVCTPMKNARQ